MALVFTTTELAAMKAALVTGAKSVQVGDRKIDYRDQSELISLIQMAQNYLDGVPTDVDDNPNVIRPTFSRGES